MKKYEIFLNGYRSHVHADKIVVGEYQIMLIKTIDKTLGPLCGEEVVAVLPKEASVVLLEGCTNNISNITSVSVFAIEKGKNQPEEKEPLF